MAVLPISPVVKGLTRGQVNVQFLLVCTRGVWRKDGKGEIKRSLVHCSILSLEKKDEGLVVSSPPTRASSDTVPSPATLSVQLFRN